MVATATRGLYLMWLVSAKLTARFASSTSCCEQACFDSLADSVPQRSLMWWQRHSWRPELDENGYRSWVSSERFKRFVAFKVSVACERRS